MRILPWSIGSRGGSTKFFDSCTLLDATHFFLGGGVVLEHVKTLDEFFLINLFKIYAQIEENFTKKDNFNCEQ